MNNIVLLVTAPIVQGSREKLIAFNSGKSEMCYELN